MAHRASRGAVAVTNAAAVTPPLATMVPENRADPHPFYRWLRENDPVRHADDGSWIVSRYADGAALLREELEVDGRTIPAGDQVIVVVGAANRDPAQFRDPERLDVGRPGRVGFSTSRPVG